MASKSITGYKGIKRCKWQEALWTPRVFFDCVRSWIDSCLEEEFVVTKDEQIVNDSLILLLKCTIMNTPGIKYQWTPFYFLQVLIL